MLCLGGCKNRRDKWKVKKCFKIIWKNNFWNKRKVSKSKEKKRLREGEREREKDFFSLAIRLGCFWCCALDRSRRLSIFVRGSFFHLERRQLSCNFPEFLFGCNRTSLYRRFGFAVVVFWILWCFHVFTCCRCPYIIVHHRWWCSRRWGFLRFSIFSSSCRCRRRFRFLLLLLLLLLFLLSDLGWILLLFGCRRESWWELAKYFSWSQILQVL